MSKMDPPGQGNCPPQPLVEAHSTDAHECLSQTTAEPFVADAGCPPPPSEEAPPAPVPLVPDIPPLLRSADPPPQGEVLPLRTKGEFDARVITKEAYVIALTPRFASDALALIRENFPSCADFDLTHLRRFVKYAYLPSYVRFYAWWLNGAWDPRWDERPELHNVERTLLYLLTVPTTVPKEDLLDCLVNKSTGDLHKEFQFPPLVITTNIPLTPPLSQTQADDMSRRFWPTVYKSSNPFGPHLSIWSRAKTKIMPDVGTFMRIAHQVADASFAAGIGINVGAVVVDRRSDSVQILAAAGDARWMGLQQDPLKPNQERNACSENGNVMAHAAMRAIDMVARKRARAGKRTRVANRNGADSAPIASTVELPPPVISRKNLFCPQTDEEQEIFDLVNADPDGYLCLNHEIYLTHEPCTMCSMAILHSRFGVCVYGQPMIRTGGLRAGGQMCSQATDSPGRPNPKRKLDNSNGEEEHERPTVPVQYYGDWIASGGPLSTYEVPYNVYEERDGCLYEVDESVVKKDAPDSRTVMRTGDSGPLQSSCFGLFWRPELNWKFLTWQWAERPSKSADGLSQDKIMSGLRIDPYDPISV